MASAIDLKCRSMRGLAMRIASSRSSWQYMNTEHHLRPAGVPCRLPGLAVYLHQLRGRRADPGDRHQVVAELAGAGEGVGRADRGDPERRPRLLRRPRQRGDVLVAVELSIR